MNKIVFERYPASKLPDDLRAEIDESLIVTITIETEEGEPRNAPTLEEIFARRQPPFRTVQEIDDELHRDRDSWDG